MGAEITFAMAFVDCIPVALFLIAAIILQRDLYHVLTKGAYSLVAAGSIMAFTGGAFKAAWKMLYALGVCDYVLLDHSLFTLQGPGFLLFFLGLLGLYLKGGRKEGVTLGSVSPAVVTSSLPFIVLQVIGLGGAQLALGIFGWKKGNKGALALYLTAFVFMLGMGYLGAKFDDSSGMHWIAQLTNVISMSTFLLGTLRMRKTGYETRNSD